MYISPADKPLNVQLSGIVLAATLQKWPLEDALYMLTLEVGEAAIVTLKAEVDSRVTDTFEGAFEKK